MANTRLTFREQEILEMTKKLFQALNELPVLHKSDMAENVRDIHNIQNRIMSRPEQIIQNDKP